jgi:hypothetical protein
MQASRAVKSCVDLRVTYGILYKSLPVATNMERIFHPAWKKVMAKVKLSFATG